MLDQIFLLNENKKLIELNESEFINEDQFQSLLASYPNLISGSQINPDNPRKWILISREVGIPGEEGGGNKWSIDHLFIDQEGIPTLVEVKRSLFLLSHQICLQQVWIFLLNYLVKRRRILIYFRVAKRLSPPCRF